MWKIVFPIFLDDHLILGVVKKLELHETDVSITKD